MVENADCVFCQILAGKIPSKQILETDKYFVIEDIAPKAPVHALVITKEHVENFQALPSDLALQEGLFDTIKKTTEHLKIEEAYQLRVNNGEMSGQIVPHLHVHVLGGWQKKQAG